ncbi:MAG: transglycosylase SLT domain-containing protein [Barnesiella sp.]|nr:transglycosylase SLT domain-containing protein [Barnesiella sp.]
MSRLHKLYAAALISLASLSAMAANPSSILDLKHSITDDNVVPPESFETDTRKLEESFFFKNYTVQSKDSKNHHKGNDKEYAELLAKLPVEIEMPYNSVVGQFIDMYLDRRRGLVADMLALHNYYGQFFIEELIKEGMPLELQYLPVIESALNPNAVSKAGATGLWQFMGPTAKGLGMEVNSLVDERRDPRVSSKHAARYLKQLYGIYGDWSLAIAAYNCGPGNVNKALRRAGGGKLDFWEIYNYLPKETRGYVPVFIAANYVMNYYNRYGITPTIVKQQLVTDTVQVNDRVHFKQIAEVLQIPIEEIRMLNPQFRKDIIPGDSRPYMLTLPSQKALSYTVSEEAILACDAGQDRPRTHVEPGRPRNSVPAEVENTKLTEEQTQNSVDNKQTVATVPDKVDEMTHTVGRGESLRDIAKHYGVSSTDIKRWNNLRRGKVKEGDKLIVRVYRHETPQASTKPSGESTVKSQKKDVAKTPVPPPPGKKNSADKRNDRDKKSEKTVASTSKKNTATSRQDKKAADKKKKKEKKPTSTPYKVKSGDNLEKIAKKYGTTVEAIQKANGMSKGTTRLNIDQNLKIPTGSAAKKNDSKAKANDKKSKNDKKGSKNSKSDKKNDKKSGKSGKSGKDTSKSSKKSGSSKKSSKKK